MSVAPTLVVGAGYLTEYLALMEFNGFKPGQTVLTRRCGS